MKPDGTDKWYFERQAEFIMKLSGDKKHQRQVIVELAEEAYRRGQSRIRTGLRELLDVPSNEETVLIAREQSSDE